MKLILIALLPILMGCTNYSKDTTNCTLLNKAISSEYAKREFFLCKDETEFILYDKKRQFKNCDHVIVCGKQIKISHDIKHDELGPNDNHYSEGDKPIIILHRVEKDGQNYKLYFWRPYSGAVVNLTYKIDNKKIELTDYLVGTI